MNQQILKLTRFVLPVFIFSLVVMFSLGVLNTNAGENGPPPPGPPTPPNLCQSPPVMPDDMMEDGEDGTQPGPIVTQGVQGCELEVVLDGCAKVVGELGGINCGEDCDQVFQTVTQVALVATPGPDSEFVRWESLPECAGSNPVLNVLVDHSFTCTAICQEIGGGGEEGINIGVSGDLVAVGDDNEDFVIVLDPGTANAREIDTVAQQANQFENVVVVINLPEGTIVNSASVNDDTEACEIVNDTQVQCTIPELTEATSININLFVPDLGGMVQQVQVLLTTDTVPGQTLEQFLNITSGSATTGATGSGGCTLADAGSKKTLLLFALLPAVVFFRRLRRK